jgi:hypothetical protein
MALRTKEFFRARRGRCVAKWPVLSVVSNYIVTIKIPGLLSCGRLGSLTVVANFCVKQRIRHASCGPNGPSVVGGLGMSSNLQDGCNADPEPVVITSPLSKSLEQL